MDELVKRLRELQTITEHCDEQSCDECENRELCDKHDNKTLSGTYKEAADAIEELSKPKWIPVTERLPENDKNVLICYEWTGRSGTVYREVGIASIEELERDPTELFRPICWMPLPQPPKEES